MRVHELTPEPLFPRSDDGARLQVARLALECDGPESLVVEVTAPDGRTTTTAMQVTAGRSEREVLIPEVRRGETLHIQALRTGGETAAEARFTCSPQRRWTVYVMATGHIDLYSTGLAHETPEEHAVVLDAALALAEEFPDFRYQVENMLPLFEYRERRDKTAMNRLMDRVRAAQIGFGAQFTGIHHEEASGEEIVQGQLLRMRELEAEFGVRPNCAYTVDVPNTTVQFAQLVAACALSGWIFSPNRFPPPDGWYGLGESIRRLPWLISAQGLDGSRVPTWLPHEHYGEDQRLFGMTNPDIDAWAPLVAARLSALEAEGYPWDLYLLEHSYGDNLPPERALPLLIGAWNARYEYPRLAMSTAADFFDAVRTSGIEPPAMRLQVLDAWAFIVANQGVLNQVARRASNRLLSAQALLALTPGAGYPEGEFREAFADLAKFAAHDWWYGGGQVAGVPDLAKADWAHNASRIASGVMPGAVGGQAFNPCGFDRKDIILLPAGDGAAGQLVGGKTAASHFHPAPYSIAHPDEEPTAADAVVALADVAACSPVPLASGAPAASKRHEGVVLENRYYRVEFDGQLGAIAHVIDKEDGRELVDSAQLGLGGLMIGRPQYEGFGVGFGVTREQAVERMRQSLTSWEKVVVQAEGGLSGPVFSSLVLRGQAHSSPVTQAVVLYEDLKRIDITISVEWDNLPRACRLVAAFPFAMAEFDCRYEVPFGVLEVGRDETSTAPRHLRQLQTWLQFREGDRSIVVASPDVGVFSLGRCDLNPVMDGEYTFPERTHAYFILADNGAPSPLVQPGRLAARFSFTSGDGLRASDCARFGWSLARPLAMAAEGTRGISVEPDSVLISAVKRSWDGRGLAVRVVEYDGAGHDVRLALPFAPSRAWLCAPVEHPLKRLPVEGDAVRFPIRGHGIVTLLLEQ